MTNEQQTKPDPIRADLTAARGRVLAAFRAWITANDDLGAIVRSMPEGAADGAEDDALVAAMRFDLAVAEQRMPGIRAALSPLEG